uniref:Uncharacterized protein n=1 Tax=viral metagenome TaxID=1070528 RepID=A0A6C0EEF4_9ZZZZ
MEKNDNVLTKEKSTSNKIINSTLLNIDSSFRNINPKHIYISNNKILNNNPLVFTKGSNIITVNYNNHNLSINDNIIIQNVVGLNKILYKSLYLINNLKYFVINIDDNMIDLDYKNYVNESIYINIELYKNQSSSNYINNIPLNSLIGIKQCLIGNDIINNLNTINKQALINLCNNIYQTYNDEILNTKFIFCNLNIPYIDANNNDFLSIDQIFQISYLHINGIKLGNINSNYPINNYFYQSYQTVSKIINENSFEISLNYTSYGNSSSGGSNIQIYKILNSITGYPDANKYVINLKKSFNNVTNIELISTEISYIDLLISKNINDKLYWKNIEDGDYIYIAQIDEGFYTSITLLNKLKSIMNSIPRINNSITNQLNNNFDINLNTDTHIITFEPFNLTKLANSLSLKINIINNIKYYILNVNHPNNLVDINDTITISSSNNVTIYDENNITQINSIDSSYINKTHQVYAININNSTYDIIIGKINEITISLSTTTSAGGENILIKSKTKISFLFNKSDTIGDILGFINVGSQYSITDYKSSITNQDLYIYSNNVNSVGNSINYANGFFNLSGSFNYILMYINDIEYIYSNNNLPSAFAKILLSGNPGDVLFNTFVRQPNNIYSKTFPINTLTDLSILFLYPDGSLVNFRNINHSFTLKITEEKLVNDNTYLNSKLF